MVRITGLCLLVPNPRDAVLDVLLLNYGDNDDTKHNPRLYVDPTFIKPQDGAPAPIPISQNLAYVELAGRCIDLTKTSYLPAADSLVKPSDFVANISRVTNLLVNPQCFNRPNHQIAARLRLPPATFAYTISPGNWSYGSVSNQLANILHCSYPGLSNSPLTLKLEPDGGTEPTWTYSMAQNDGWFTLEVGNITKHEEPKSTQPATTINPGEKADDFGAYYSAMVSQSDVDQPTPSWDSAPTEISPAPMRGSFVKCMLAQASR